MPCFLRRRPQGRGDTACEAAGPPPRWARERAARPLTGPTSIRFGIESGWPDPVRCRHSIGKFSASPPLAPPPAAASVEGGGAVSVGEGGAGRGPEQPPADLPADPSPVADNAHELVLRSPFVLCRRCGAYVSAERGAKRLKDLCPGPLPPLDRCSPAERERRRRREKLLQGLHPTSGASPGA
ncbi:unnamed protein product [Prorocentrum cordatum]|uniref:Uncharacterized protein n=1 Tax=Prorocentrum cordatum TaxID=2364126 RepID=A0ABN9X2F7_9DINO|nr:unnamed protein product [Polarella glacialis]